MSRLQEYWSLSRTHSTAAGYRATCIMLQSGLSMPAAHSHNHSCANLHCSDILLHQQVGQSRRSTIPQQAVCAEVSRLLPLSSAAARICTLPGLSQDSPHPQSVTLTRALHGPSSWCCVLHETRVGLPLARGTFAAAIFHTKWDLTSHTRRRSKRLPQRLTEVPTANHIPPEPYLP